MNFNTGNNAIFKKSVTKKALYAGIIGNSCAIGTQKLGRISSQINANNLDHIINWYFFLENIQAVSDRVLELLNKMEHIIFIDGLGVRFTLEAMSKNVRFKQTH